MTRNDLEFVLIFAILFVFIDNSQNTLDVKILQLKLQYSNWYYNNTLNNTIVHLILQYNT